MLQVESQRSDIIQSAMKDDIYEITSAKKEKFHVSIRKKDRDSVLSKKRKLLKLNADEQTTVSSQSYDERGLNHFSNFFNNKPSDFGTFERGADYLDNLDSAEEQRIFYTQFVDRQYFKLLLQMLAKFEQEVLTKVQIQKYLTVLHNCFANVPELLEMYICSFMTTLQELFDQKETLRPQILELLTTMTLSSKPSFQILDKLEYFKSDDLFLEFQQDSHLFNSYIGLLESMVRITDLKNIPQLLINYLPGNYTNNLQIDISILLIINSYVGRLSCDDAEKFINKNEYFFIDYMMFLFDVDDLELQTITLAIFGQAYAIIHNDIQEYPKDCRYFDQIIRSFDGGLEDQKFLKILLKVTQLIVNQPSTSQIDFIIDRLLFVYQSPFNSTSIVNKIKCLLTRLMMKENCILNAQINDIIWSMVKLDGDIDEIQDNLQLMFTLCQMPNNRDYDQVLVSRAQLIRQIENLTLHDNTEISSNATNIEFMLKGQ